MENEKLQQLCHKIHSNWRKLLSRAHPVLLSSSIDLSNSLTSSSFSSAYDFLSSAICRSTTEGFWGGKVGDEVVACEASGKVARMVVEDSAEGRGRVEAAVVLHHTFSHTMLHEAPAWSCSWSLILPWNICATVRTALTCQSLLQSNLSTFIDHIPQLLFFHKWIRI